MAGKQNKRIYEYDLSTAWDVTTASFLQSKLIITQDTSPNGIFFRQDGLKMYMAGDTNNRVYEYDLTSITGSSPVLAMTTNADNQVSLYGNFNEGTALEQNSDYIFETSIRGDSQINFKSSVIPITFLKLQVELFLES